MSENKSADEGESAAMGIFKNLMAKHVEEHGPRSVYPETQQDLWREAAVQAGDTKLIETIDKVASVPPNKAEFTAAVKSIPTRG